MGRKLRVGVLFGGRSGEHEVSLSSATSVMSAIDRNQYEVTALGITKTGRWVLGEDALCMLETGNEPTSGKRVVLPPDPSHPDLILLDENRPGQATEVGERVDLIFPVLHGPFGEDGTIQGLLDLAGVPYVGAGVVASAVGMDKLLMKAVFGSCGLPSVKYTSVKRNELACSPAAVVERVFDEVGCPCFVKPANLGSSVGIHKVHDCAELLAALDAAAKFDRKLIVEEAVVGREVECSVLGNDQPEASVVGEIIPCNEFYDYRAKYIDNRSELKIPAEIAADISQEVRRLALEAFVAIDCAGLARVDFFIRGSDSKVLVNEINTIPGFTSISMYPKLWEASGLAYPKLIDRLIQLALDRHSDRSRSQTWYDGV
jgi:D-alanine-D-alanine ligase